MDYDIFLSHSSGDRALVDEVRDSLKALGYRIFVDYEVLPQITPEEVTRETADALQKAMRACWSLVYVLSAKSARSNWMPWELGYFDGFRGRVFIWPGDDQAEAHARDRRYVSLYPRIPQTRREEFIRANLPRAQEAQFDTTEKALEGVDPPRPPLIDHANKLMTAQFAEQLPGMLGDPARAMQAASEITEAWWRLWGFMPPPRRPGGDR